MLVELYASLFLKSEQQAEVTLQFVYDSATSEAKEKPVTWCNDVKHRIHEIEHMQTARSRLYEQLR